MDAKFDSYAKTYNDLHAETVKTMGDDPDYFAGYKIAYLREKEPDGQAIFDFGCGVGNCLKHLVEEFPRSMIYGADISADSVELARQAAPGVILGVIDGSLPVQRHSMDAAIAVGVFHHIPPEERQGWVEQLRIALKPGGRLYFFEHNPLNPVTRKVVRECPFDDDAILLPHQESEKRMADAGFTDIRTEYVMFFPKALGVFRPFERYLRWLPIGAQYVTSGRA